jgi:hypothetical protein
LDYFARSCRDSSSADCWILIDQRIVRAQEAPQRSCEETGAEEFQPAFRIPFFAGEDYENRPKTHVIVVTRMQVDKIAATSAVKTREISDMMRDSNI